MILTQPMVNLWSSLPQFVLSAFHSALGTLCLPAANLPLTAAWCASHGARAPVNLGGGRPASRRAAGVAGLTSRQASSRQGRAGGRLVVVEGVLPQMSLVRWYAGW